MARILIIDDNDQVREVMRRIVEAEKHEVIEACNGLSGMEMLRRNAPVDLIITDILMPEQDGLETIMRTKWEFPNLKILAISGGGHSLGRDSCLAPAKTLGAHAVLSKPFGREELVKAINSLLVSAGT